jgi:hypothetical protein
LPYLSSKFLVVCQYLINFLDFLLLYLSYSQIWINPLLVNHNF